MWLGSDRQPGDLVLDLEFSLLETADRVVVGMGSGILFSDRMLERCMLGLQRFDVVDGAHRENLHGWLANVEYVTPGGAQINLSPTAVHNSVGLSQHG